MDFEEFQSAINTADVKVFENTLATAAISGDWSAVSPVSTYGTDLRL